MERLQQMQRSHHMLAVQLRVPGGRCWCASRINASIRQDDAYSSHERTDRCPPQPSRRPRRPGSADGIPVPQSLAPGANRGRKTGVQSRLPLPVKSGKIGVTERGVQCVRCPRCQEEVALAHVCPYCGQRMPSPSSDDAPQQKRSTRQEAPRGQFRGIIDGPPGARGSSPAERIPIWFLLPRYLLDRSVPLTRKLLLLLGVLYIIIPFDITPDFIPLLGWLDDIGVGTFLWYYLRNELISYRQRL